MLASTHYLVSLVGDDLLQVGRALQSRHIKRLSCIGRIAGRGRLLLDAKTFLLAQVLELVVGEDLTIVISVLGCCLLGRCIESSCRGS